MNRFATRLIGFVFLLIAPWLSAETWYVPHLPADSGNFDVRIVVENQTDTDRVVVFDSVLNDYKTSMEYTIAAKTRVLLDPSEVFGSDRVTFFSVSGGKALEESVSPGSLTGLVIGVSMSYADQPDSGTYIDAIREMSRTWRVHLGDWSHFFDGLAVINSNYCGGGTLTLNHYDNNGRLLKEVTVASDRWEKQLLIVNNLLDYATGSYVDVVSSSNIAVTALRGYHAFDRANAFLVGNLALPIPTRALVQEEVNGSRAVWRANGFDSYSMTLAIGCFCPLLRPVDIVVRRGEIESVTYEENGEAVDPDITSLFATIDSLYTIIQESLDRDSYRVRVDYDKELGIPLNIFIDQSVCIADDEFNYQIKNFRPLR